ncbi:Imm10 family immunity protein [Streptomyces sp. NPDC058398]|uniref:Imm10 family immunity protein n=1 Tax=Streptomyces sp. NPDC058398 TaxID=3346479 RepID=UPI003661FA69
MELNIREIHQGEEYKTYTLALFTSWEDDMRGFELQRNLRESGDPRAPRPPFNSYCVVNERHKTSFGGVTEVALEGDVLKIKFSEQAKEELDLPTDEVSLVLNNLENDEIENLKAGLARVFSYGPVDLLPNLRITD